MGGVRKQVRQYVFAVAAVAAALFLRVPAWNLLGTHVPLLTFLGPVLLTAWFEGFRPAIVASVLGAVAAESLSIYETHSHSLWPPANLLPLGFYFLLSTLVAWAVERMRVAQNEAERQQTLVQLTLTSVADGVIVTSAGGRLTLMNPAAEAITGWSNSEAFGKCVADVFRVHDGDTVTNALRKQIQGRFEPETVLTTKDQRQIHVEGSAAPVLDHDNDLIGAVLVFRDVSRRKAEEERTRLVERQISQLVHSGVIGVVFGHISGAILDANDEFLRMVERSRAELNSGSITWTTLTPPEYRDVSLRAMEEARARGFCTPFEKEYIRKDGRRVPILIGYVLLEPDRERSVAFVADLTSRRQAEANLRKLNEDLQHFTYGASHDLKEPLRMVTSYVQLLQRKYRGKLGAEADEYIQFALEGADRMAAVLSALLEFSRAGQLNRAPVEPVDASQSLQESLASLRVAVEETGAVVSASGPLPSVLVNQTHLTQIFQNLVGNAIKYHGPEPPRIQVAAEVQDGSCQFSVEDNGLGVEPGQSDRIFAPFQRLHGRSGTGLGLATTKRLIERYGGKIWVESEGDGKGSTFRFTLPADRNNHS